MNLTLPNGNIASSQSDFSAGIADYEKGGNKDEYAFGRSIDYRTNPQELTLLPKTAKESGSVILGLPKDGDLVGTDLYYYDDAGRIYKRTAAGSHSMERNVADSHGNGMKYYSEDFYLYYTTDKAIGRFGQINSGSPTYVDDFLGAQGGIPLNTYALDLEASSSQYAWVADTASLSITGDLAIEAWIKPESLPTIGNSMVIASKWDVNGNIRSYKFEVYAVSGYFGDGSDGALTVSTDTTQAPKDAICSGTSGTVALTYASASATFLVGEQILIHQTQGTNAGTWMRTKIAGVSGTTSGTITTEDQLNISYTTGAQVIQLKQYTNVTIDATKTWTAKAWNGLVGGILAFLYNGTLTVNGTISANGKGFRGGAGGRDVDYGGNRRGYQGESSSGFGIQSAANNGMAGGGGYGQVSPSTDAGSGGGGGAYAAAGTNGTNDNQGDIGATAGQIGGTTDLNSALLFGGAGGGGGIDDSTFGGDGGNSGGIIFAMGVTLTIHATTGLLTSNGANGTVSGDSGGGGGGASGGSIFLKFQTATLNTSRMTVAGGTGATGHSAFGGIGGNGGNGSVGRIHVDYLTSFTGSASPTINSAQDNNLVTTTTYQLRLGLSSTGTNEEFLTKNTTITAGSHWHVAVSWDASSSEAEFMQDGNSLGTSVGALTAINNNASRFAIGADFNNSARNFGDWVTDEVRIWNTERTADQINANKTSYISAASAGLVAWYKLNNSYADASANANDLAGANSPVFVTDVPFSAATTRQDLDQELNTSGNTYTLAAAINEGATHRQTFTPDRDPQKSIEVLVAAVGTGDWVLTVHDALNRVVATKTITIGNMHTGDNEFVFDTPWIPIRGANYHFHLTQSTADGTVTTTTASDLETVDFHTYFQFLVTDTDYHPIEQMLNLLCIGNGRYVATYAADGVYNPHRLVFPSGWRVRCFTKWKGYIVIGFWKGTNIYDTDMGAFALWDGKSETYDQFIELPEGAVNAMVGSKGKLHIWAGYHGDKFTYYGGDSVDESETKRIPKIANDEYLEVMPKAVTMWDALLRWGVAGNSSAADVERGVYTHGRQKASRALSLSYDYPISTGTRASTNVKIGFVFPVARKLLIGWQDGSAYGMDVVDPSAAPFASGVVERNIEDAAAVWKKKKALVVRADFRPLAAGESIKLKYKLDRASVWTEGSGSNLKGLASTAGDTHARINIPMGDYKELQVAAELATTGATAPTLLGISYELNPNKNQGII